MKTKAFKIIWTVFFILISIVFLMPFLWMISSSLKTSPQVFETPFHWITDRLHFENYMEIWTSKDFPFLRLYGNSVFVAVLSVLGQIFISSTAAYAFSIIKCRGSNVIFIIFLVTMMIPAQALIIPRYILFRNIGLYNTLWCIILPNFFEISSIFLFKQFYSSFPKELIEAAYMDGAGHFKIWATIVMPLTKNVIISISVLCFITVWNEYLSPLVFLANQKMYTVTLGVRYYLTNTSQDFNLMLAAAASAIVPVVIIYAVAQNYFEEGITKTGIKG